MDIAFYAPMKAPDHPVPSGDRRMAKLLIKALRLAGHRVSVASRLRTYNDDGCDERQTRLGAAARRTVDRYVTQRRGTPPDLWFTYHSYYKAPDLLGPGISDVLGIPYVIADASVAPKRANGPWADGYAAAMAAVHRADRLIAFDPEDLPCLRRLRPDDVIATLPPPARVMSATGESRRAARQALAASYGLDPSLPWLAVVAMMRPGAKRRSYAVLAKALERLGRRDRLLLVAGDGPARPEVEENLRAATAVRFLGELAQHEVRTLHLASDIAVWPGIDEGYCMALVEAQAAGLPVVAGDRPGIASVVRHGETGLLTREGDVDAFADALAALLDDPDRRSAMARAAARAARRFAVERTAAQLDAVLSDVRPREPVSA